MRRNWSLSVLVLLVPFVIAGAGVAAYLGTITPVNGETSSAIGDPAGGHLADGGGDVAKNSLVAHASKLLDRVPPADGAARGYLRDSFGKGWKDPDKNGCDARNDTLARDMTNVVFKPGTHECVVTMGTLVDPYTTNTIAFVKGNSSSTRVQIDHVVPLSWAWKYGASQWQPTQRELFANDPANLLAVDGPANESKSDSGPASWQPVLAFRCDYAEKWVNILTTYDLSIPNDDRRALRRVLSGCS